MLGAHGAGVSLEPLQFHRPGSGSWRGRSQAGGAFGRTSVSIICIDEDSALRLWKNESESLTRMEEIMNNIVYIVGLVVVVGAIVAFVF